MTQAQNKAAIAALERHIRNLEVDLAAALEERDQARSVAEAIAAEYASSLPAGSCPLIAQAESWGRPQKDSFLERFRLIRDRLEEPSKGWNAVVVDRCWPPTWERAHCGSCDAPWWTLERLENGWRLWRLSARGQYDDRSLPFSARGR